MEFKPLMEWVTDEYGQKYPKYTEEQAQRIARAAWGIHFLLPHPDNEKQYAEGIREFNRSIQCLPKLVKTKVSA
jgi:hypothetical protein